MTFKEVIGQEEVKRRLLQLVDEERVPHALMFCGPSGSGKLALAIAFGCYLLSGSKSDWLSDGVEEPMLKKLEQKGYLTRRRSTEDERNLMVEITEDGEKLREQAVTIPERMGQCVNLSPKDAGELYRLLYQILGNIEA
jgi:DNA polymerase III delta prime subunit